MNLQTKMPTTADEFLRWNEGREGRREFVRGRVVEIMINNSKRHALLALRLGSILLRLLPYPAYTIGTSDVSVRTPDGVRYPDVFVNRETEGRYDTDLSAENPLLLAEILSPSFYDRDFVEKLEDYRAVPSLRHYLILSQDEPRIWLWSREADTSWSGPREIIGHDENLELPDLGVTIDLAELYAGIQR